MAEVAGPFEFELFEGDPENLRTVVATPPAMAGPWIDPASLKLKHRLGRGPFGDVWLATYHQSGNGLDEYHEVAVKMLHPLRGVYTQTFINKFEAMFYKLRGFEGACWLYGISVLDGKICIAMKFYEGSVTDRMTKLKGGKLQLPEVLRYGIELARAIGELHSIGMLCLNLKPSNYLVNEHDQVFLGDIGISYLLLGASLPNSAMSLRLGTPNYMAPELWEPQARGPVSFETDSWGFGCSIVEMLTGTLPWSGKSDEEIYDIVVIKQEKPPVPSGLPPTIENVINGCFECDFRNRPLIADILHAFQSSKEAVYSDPGWISPGNRGISNNYSAWYVSKNNLQLNDAVRSRKLSNTRAMDITEGSVVGFETNTDRENFVMVRVPGVHNPLRVHASTLDKVTFGLAVGDRVRLKRESDSHSSVGILHSVERDGSVTVAFLGLSTLWRGTITEIQTAETFFEGESVRLKANVVAPRFEWPRKNAAGRISQVLPNGCLVVKLPPGQEPCSFLADPCEVELVSHLHWAVRPVVIVLGLFTAMKLGAAVGQSMKKGKSDSKKDGNAPWFWLPVANLFGEGKKGNCIS